MRHKILDVQRITISIRKATFDKIEMARGLIPRSAYIENILSGEK